MPATLAEIVIRRESEVTSGAFRIVGDSVSTPVDHWSDFRAEGGFQIPADELWLYQDPEALASVRRGLRQAREGGGRVLSFAQYADED